MTHAASRGGSRQRCGQVTAGRDTVDVPHRGEPKGKRFMSSVPSGAPSRRPKVLIVDDNEICRAVVRESLELGGFDVVELENPLGMSRVVNHEKPDVVLMGVEMPAMEGDKAVEILLKHRLHEC